jgi:hypothetical protein
VRRASLWHRYLDTPAPALLLLAGACLLAACESPAVPGPEHGPEHVVAVDTAYWSVRWADSVRVQIAYTLDRCEELERVESAQLGDSLNVTIVARTAGTCAAARHPEGLTAFVRVAMAAPFFVLAHQPGGMVRRFAFPGFRPFIGCRGPPIGLTGWGQLTVGSETLVAVTHFCPDVAWPPHAVWSIADTMIATITPVSDSSATLRARRPGTTTLTVRDSMQWTTQAPVFVVPAP